MCLSSSHPVSSALPPSLPTLLASHSILGLLCASLPGSHTAFPTLLSDLLPLLFLLIISPLKFVVQNVSSPRERSSLRGRQEAVQDEIYALSYRSLGCVTEQASYIHGRWKISQEVITGQLVGNYGKLIISDPQFMLPLRIHFSGVKEINVI